MKSHGADNLTEVETGVTFRRTITVSLSVSGLMLI